MKRNQSGMTLIGFIIVLAVVGVFVYMGMKLIPMYTEYYGVKRALTGLAAEPGIADQDPTKIKKLFFRRLYVSYADNVKDEHVKLQRKDSGYEMLVNYEVRRPLIANLDVVGHFEAKQDIRRGSGGAD